MGARELEQFREAMSTMKKDPYQVIVRRNKLPMSLLTETVDTKARSHILDTQPFSETFAGHKKMRKRVALPTFSMEELRSQAETRASGYDVTKDKDFKDRSEGVEKKEVHESVFLKGQSKRIWGELYKVVDASDVVIQVLDARDPMGTRSKHIEDYIKREKAHKHVIFVLNKCDLVPTWSTAGWVATLSKEYPTLAFHASVNNSFGKGALIQLLRQFGRLHSDKKQISIGFIGYPNVGKSSVINTLRAEKVCKVAPIPGETKVGARVYSRRAFGLFVLSFSCSLFHLAMFI